MTRGFLFRLAACVLALSLALPLSVAAESEEAIRERFPPFCATGVMTRDEGALHAGERVTLLEGEHEKYYLVGDARGTRHRVAWDAVAPSRLSSPVSDEASAEEVASFVALLGLGSATEYLIFIDLWRMRLHVLEEGDHGFYVVRTLPCSVGDARHPTPRGRYEIRYKCACIGKEEHYLCKHAMCFYGGFMIHSVLFDWNGREVIDGRLSARISHGCIRLAPEDAGWLYRCIPVGSTVYLH